MLFAEIKNKYFAHLATAASDYPVKNAAEY